MNDYAELVKSLRFCASVATALDCDGCEWKGGKYSGLKDKDGAFLDCEEQIKLEAADAIEKLSEQLLEMGQVGKFLLDVHKINSKMVAPESVPTDSEWWSHYKALLELLYLPRWIPVTERLPDENDDVLIYGEWTGASGTKYREVWLTDLKEYMHQGYKPIAWMPLPEPPKEETE